MDEPRTYTGWKAMLLAIAACIVVYVSLNLVARANRAKPRPTPGPTVVSVAPSR